MKKKEGETTNDKQCKRKLQQKEKQYEIYVRTEQNKGLIANK